VETVVDMPPIERGPLKTRSRVSNGKLLPMTDGRSATARRFKDLVEFISVDRSLLFQPPKRLAMSGNMARIESLSGNRDAEASRAIAGGRTPRRRREAFSYSRAASPVA
jgi:hypothetical protein